MKFASVPLSVCLVAMAAEAVCKFAVEFVVYVNQILIPNLLLFLVLLLHKNTLIS
jgi:hypothetical protein